MVGCWDAVVCKLCGFFPLQAFGSLDFKVDSLRISWIFRNPTLNMKPVFPLVCLIVLGSIVSAESLQRRSPVEQALSADAVGTAQLLFKRGIEVDGMVHTKFLFQTVQSLRGKLPTHFEVFSPGGILGHRARRDSRMPTLELGRDYLLYLKQRKGSLW